MLRRGLLTLESLISAPWFNETTAQRLPRLTDYLSIRHAEAASPSHRCCAHASTRKNSRHILEAPSLFLPDLAYYRRRCTFRDARIAVAYLDIDDFKAFNTRYTETQVNLDLLNPFMEAIEPRSSPMATRTASAATNTSSPCPTWIAPGPPASSAPSRRASPETSYRGIQKPPTLSIGLAVVSVDCPLTIARCRPAPTPRRTTPRPPPKAASPPSKESCFATPIW